MGRERMGVGRCVRVCVRGGSADMPSYWFVQMVGEGHPAYTSCMRRERRNKGCDGEGGGGGIAYISSLIFWDN